MSDQEQYAFTDDAKNALNRYEGLKQREKEIKQEIDILKPQLIEIIPEDAQVGTERGGVFSIKRKTQYEYSQEVKDLEQKLKDKKKEEEQTGVAKPIPGDAYVEYRNKNG